MSKTLLIILVISVVVSQCFAECPLDHFEIGCNRDGITGTADDNELFADCTQIYRHSNPAHNEDPTWLYWHYPLYYSMIYHDYTIGEPGFDTIKADDPNHCLSGTPMVDYNIVIEVVSISQGLRGVFQGSPGFTLSQVGNSFSHSSFSDPHMHFMWRAPANTWLYWVTFQMYDTKNKYLPSEPFSMVFNTDPCAGDLAIDGKVNMTDFVEFCYFWLQDNGNRSNDFYQRADANKDGKVDFMDFCLLASNWLK